MVSENNDLNKFSDKEIEFITKMLKEKKSLPDSYRYIIPFETKKEYELTYAKKEREEDILADTLAAPLQHIKTFGNNGEDWKNKIIFGDNLQVLKALMDNPYVYDKNSGKGKVQLIYIDPPFATKQEFRGSQDQKAYQDKIAGAAFVEFLRKRLVFLRELLADNGLIYIHLDQKKSHYIKIIMDEIFGENKFLNEIIWKYTKYQMRNMNKFTKNSDRLLLYSKTSSYDFYPITYKLNEPKKLLLKGWDKELGRIVNIKDEQGKTQKITIYDEKVDDVWNIPYIGATAYERLDFPTQKPEKILHWVITSATKKGDLILDAFAGSGTTMTVAEKLHRRWIGIDSSKLAIYTIQKRMLNLKDKIGNRGKPVTSKPFILYNAGLYDYRMIKELPWENYRDFVLKLFQCRNKKHRIAGVELDGYLGADNVLVFNYKKNKDVILDRGFIDALHKILGDKIGRTFFIIAPAASVLFLEDYIEKDDAKYFILRIPYSIIEEMYHKGFTPIK